MPGMAPLFEQRGGRNEKDFNTGASQMNEQRVLILGGLGFIGSSLAHKLVEIGAQVTIYDACLDPYGWNFANIEEISDEIEFIKGDIRDFDLLKQHVRDKDCIFHCAAQVGHVISMQDPFLDIDINCRGTVNLLEACRRFNNGAEIVYTGTRGQVGEPEYLPVDENHPDSPTDIYGINKLAAEKYLSVYHEVHGIPFVSMRLNNIYGPRAQMKHGHYAVVNYLLALAMQGKTITVYGDGSQTRDFLYIDDAVDALILAAQKEEAIGEVFMVGSGVETKFIDMVELVIQTVGKGRYVNIPYPREREKIDIRRFAGSYAKLNRVLGWKPTTSLEEGISKTLAFYETRLSEYV